MSAPSPRLVYSPEYNIRFFGLERFHPFDSCKYGRAWAALSERFEKKLDRFKIVPDAPVSFEALARIHTKEYLDLLHSPPFLAQIIELPELRLLPPCLLEKCVLKPMKFATQGTILAAEAALATGMAVNLSGGYHHASRDRGEGFCVYSDIAVAIADLKESGALEPDDTVVIIDLDAHQGNGLERIFSMDPSVHIFDMFNQNVYPQDWWAQSRIDYGVPLFSGTEDQEYLDQLNKHLTSFLSQVPQPKLAFYNAGTDIYDRDPLGRMGVSAGGVLERDRFVFNTLTETRIPWVMVLSGGYTRESYRLVADSITYILNRWGLMLN